MKVLELHQNLADISYSFPLSYGHCLKNSENITAIVLSSNQLWSKHESHKLFSTLGYNPHPFSHTLGSRYKQTFRSGRQLMRRRLDKCIVLHLN